MLAFGVGPAANGFAVRHLGRLQREVHVIAFVQFRDDHLDMLLPGPGKQKFLGLRVAHEVQCGIFLDNFVNRDADLVLVGARFGFDRERDRRFRQLRRLVVDGRGFVAQRFAGRRFFQFGDRADVAGVQLRNFSELLALHNLRMLKAFRACRDCNS